MTLGELIYAAIQVLPEGCDSQDPDDYHRAYWDAIGTTIIQYMRDNP